MTALESCVSSLTSIQLHSLPSCITCIAVDIQGDPLLVAQGASLLQAQESILMLPDPIGVMVR